ncbi:MAG: hypothetical protein IT337_09915 [Thermomicrobiales bacterium]|nr:hypothetical protein [Thermomicrobiales bacterium]
MFSSPNDVVPPDENIVQPGIPTVSPEREALVSMDAIYGAPGVAVEILSAESWRTGAVRKRALYARLAYRGIGWSIPRPASSPSISSRRETMTGSFRC